MPFVPDSKADINAMLSTIGVDQIEDLFDEIPLVIKARPFEKIPENISESELTRLMTARANEDGVDLNFIGAGAYEHYIPWAVWDIVSRGEIMTSYTPYQAEASQGNLQMIYEYQSMISSLMGLDCSNASLYDGASGLAEAILMAVRIQLDKPKKILILGDVSPNYLEVLHVLLPHQGIEIDLDLNLNLDKNIKNLYAAVVIVQPSFLGLIQPVDVLTDWAHAAGALVIALVNPIAMSLLKPPGEWSAAENLDKGADIACGEAQPLGVPLAFGGPYLGFICCKKKYVRQMPGRIVGRTIDLEGKEGFCLTLQAREQHIRRAKATSNICTNQGLLVAAAMVYMSLLGETGLKQVAKQCYLNALALREKLIQIDGVKLIHTGPWFHEFAVSMPLPIDKIREELAREGIQAGIEVNMPGFSNVLLICSTEVHTSLDHDRYVNALKYVLSQAKIESCFNKNTELDGVTGAEKILC